MPWQQLHMSYDDEPAVGIMGSSSNGCDDVECLLAFAALVVPCLMMVILGCADGCRHAHCSLCRRRHQVVEVADVEQAPEPVVEEEPDAKEGMALGAAMRGKSMQQQLELLHSNPRGKAYICSLDPAHHDYHLLAYMLGNATLSYMAKQARYVQAAPVASAASSSNLSAHHLAGADPSAHSDVSILAPLPGFPAPGATSTAQADGSRQEGDATFRYDTFYGVRWRNSIPVALPPPMAHYACSPRPRPLRSPRARSPRSPRSPPNSEGWPSLHSFRSFRDRFIGRGGATANSYLPERPTERRDLTGHHEEGGYEAERFSDERPPTVLFFGLTAQGETTSNEF